MGGFRVGNVVLALGLNCPDKGIDKGASDPIVLACRGIGKDAVMHVELGLGASCWLASIP